jgi:hypothetical protein
MQIVNERVIVVVKGADEIRRLFRARPSTVRFGTLAPSEPRWRERVVDVQYRPD